MEQTNKQVIRRMTLTAILLALLIGGQLLFGLIGQPLSQYFVGSWVNLIIAVSAFSLGWPYALALGLISPFVALLVGIVPPFIEFTPFIALGNGLFAITIYLISRIKVSGRFQVLVWLLGVTIASFAKAGLMYVTIVVLIMPTLGLNQNQITLLSAVFSINQIPTALIGGGLATFVAVPLRIAIKYRKGARL